MATTFRLKPPRARLLPSMTLLLACSLVSSCELVTGIPGESVGGSATTVDGGNTTNGGGALVLGTGGSAGIGGSGASSAIPIVTGGSNACAGTGGSASEPSDGGIATSILERSLLAFNPAPDVSSATQASLVTDLNDFGVKVFQDLAPTNSNFAVSPVSGFVALTMTADGARGSTADEIKSVLYPDVAVSDIQSATNQLAQRVHHYALAPVQTNDGVKKIDLNLANDVFIQSGLGVQRPFLDNLSVNYDAGVERVDFVNNSSGACDQINAWVASETNCLIQNLIPQGGLDQWTRLVLVNALYLYSSWQTAFNPKYTESETFYGINGNQSTDFMQATLTVKYASGTGWQGVDIPYYGGSLVFTAILPDSGQFAAVKSSLGASWLSNFDATAQATVMGVFLPKFKISGSSASWLNTLETLGIKKLFSGESDLSGITQDEILYVKDVLQQVYVDVSEQGTEAAAATAVITYTISIAGSPSPPPIITFNRPFLFFVREPNGPVLFAGQVVTLPTAQ